MSEARLKGRTVTDVVNEIKSKIGDEAVSFDVDEITQEQEKEYIDNLHWCANHYLGKQFCTEKQKATNCTSIAECRKRYIVPSDFYIISLLKNEKAFNGFAVRNYFIAVPKCPTPTFDQTVYRFNAITGNIELLWTLPNAEACGIIRHYRNYAPPEYKQLLGFVMDFWSGELDNAVNFLNGDVLK